MSRFEWRNLPQWLLVALITTLPVVTVSGGYALLTASPDFIFRMEVTNYDRKVYSELCEGQDGDSVDSGDVLPDRWDETDDYQRRKKWWDQIRQKVRYAEIALDHAGKRLGGAWEVTSCSTPDRGMLSDLTREKAIVRTKGRDDDRETTIEVSPSTLECEIIESS